MVGEPVFSVAILTIGIDILLKNFLDNWIGLNPRYMGDPFPSYGNFGSVSINVGGYIKVFRNCSFSYSIV